MSAGLAIRIEGALKGYFEGLALAALDDFVLLRGHVDTDHPDDREATVTIVARNAGGPLVNEGIDEVELHVVVMTPADGTGMSMHVAATEALRAALQESNLPGIIAALNAGDVLRVSALEFVSDEEARDPVKGVHGSDLGYRVYAGLGAG